MLDTVIYRLVFLLFCLDYRTCLQDARLVNCERKKVICPNFKYAFHAELELHLNCYFADPRERWSLLFTDILPPPALQHPIDENEFNSAPVSRFYNSLFFIYHNAKVKFCCEFCGHEWASARGRALFQTSIPAENTYNVLFVDLFRQRCQRCRREIEPSWYLEEVVRVMQETSRILIRRFYAARNFPLVQFPPRPIVQRRSQTQGPHLSRLCQACQQGLCLRTRRHC